MTKLFATEAGIMFQDAVQVQPELIEIYKDPKNRRKILNALQDFGIEHMMTENNESVVTVIIDKDKFVVDENNISDVIEHLKEDHDNLRKFLWSLEEPKAKDPLDLFKKRLKKKNQKNSKINIPIAIVCLDIDSLKDIIEYGEDNQGEPGSPSNG